MGQNGGNGIETYYGVDVGPFGVLRVGGTSGFDGTRFTGLAGNVEHMMWANIPGNGSATWTNSTLVYGNTSVTNVASTVTETNPSTVISGQSQTNVTATHTFVDAGLTDFTGIPV